MLYLRDGRRVADLVKSPSRPRTSAMYAVTEAGVRGVRGSGAAEQRVTQPGAGGAGSYQGSASGSAPVGNQGGERGGEPPPKLRRH